MKKLLPILFLSLFAFSCSETETNPAKELLNETIEAHGGLDKWNSYAQLSYTVESGGSESNQTHDLKNRRTYHKSNTYEMGFDGNEAWIKGDTAVTNKMNPAFVHNIDFYFFAMPFVIADPGVKLVLGEPMKVQGETYDVLEVSYGEGVGVAPKDIYKLLIDPDTKRMEWLLYTVTFFDEASDRLSAKRYSGWEEVQGILVPTKMENYKIEDGEITGEPSRPRTFTNIEFSEKLIDESAFEK